MLSTSVSISTLFLKGSSAANTFLDVVLNTSPISTTIEGRITVLEKIHRYLREVLVYMNLDGSYCEIIVYTDLAQFTIRQD